MNVDFHSGQGVNQGNRVGSRSLRGPCHLRDVGDVGAQLHNNGLSGSLFYLGSDIVKTVRPLSKGNGSLFYVGAGYVDFQHVCLFIRKPLHHFKIILHAFSADIHNNSGVILAKKRKVSFHKNVDSRILQADGVEHTAMGFRYSWRRISRPGDIGHSFGHHCPKPVQVHKIAVFHTGAKGSGGRHHGIFKFNACNCNLCIHQISTSPASKTGPSVQILVLFTWECPSFRVVLHTQPRHAPTPQAILSSRDR